VAMVIRFYEAGGPEVLRCEEMDVPCPGPREVKIKVEAIVLNRAEIAYREGRYLERPKFPSKLGYEGAGTVIEVGSEIRGVMKGERVGVIPDISMAEYGTYGEEILVPASSVTPCPEYLSCVTFAAVWMQYLTCLRCARGNWRPQARRVRAHHGGFTRPLLAVIGGLHFR
jgi:NADPH:quinone reductase-like Zn-dependent oxidoreductase